MGPIKTSVFEGYSLCNGKWIVLLVETLSRAVTMHRSEERSSDSIGEFPMHRSITDCGFVIFDGFLKQARNTSN